MKRIEVYKQSAAAIAAKAKRVNSLLSYSDSQRSPKASTITTIRNTTRPTIAKVKRQTVLDMGLD
jgi:hypothetical protein